MTTLNPRKKAVREYKKDTFKAHQDSLVNKRAQAIDEALVLLGKSELKFRNITQLAEHVSAILKKGDEPCNVTTLVRRHHTRDGAESPNPYRILLQKYELGKYFGKSKNVSITAQDIEVIRKKYPAVDAYCSLKDGESKILREQVKHLTREVDSLQGIRSLPLDSITTGDLPNQLDKTVTALKRLLDATQDFFEIDWQQRAIVDTSLRIPKVVVETDLLSAFFRALENSGMKPSEER